MKQEPEKLSPEERERAARDRRRRNAARFNAAMFLGGFAAMSTGLHLVSIELGLIVSGAVALGLSVTWAFRHAG